jgi:hypothetical protein
VALWRWSLRRLPFHRRPPWCCSVLLRHGSGVGSGEEGEKSMRERSGDLEEEEEKRREFGEEMKNEGEKEERGV